MPKVKESLFSYNSKYKDILYSWVAQDLKAKISPSILDVGCGRGEALERINVIPGDKMVYGVDISRETLKFAKKKLEKFKWTYILAAKAQDLAFQDESFDVVICSEVIEHIKAVDELLEEIRRVLKPQGAFIVTTPSRFNYTTLFGKLIPLRFKKYLRKGVYYLNPGSEGFNPHVYEYTPKELRALLEKKGFIFERSESGVLRVPIWTLFERLPFLVVIWRCLDRLVDKMPFGIYLKLNFLVLARKTF